MSSRLVYAAAHVVLQESYAQCEHSPECPGAPEAVAEHIDWPATMGIRTWLAGYGFGIAEAMDTAQRYELGWPTANLNPEAFESVLDAEEEGVYVGWASIGDPTLPARRST